MSWIFETTPSFAFIFLRLGLAIAFFFHSTQQIFGWFGGRGMKGMLDNWKDKYGIPGKLRPAGRVSHAAVCARVGDLHVGGYAEGSLGVWILLGASSGRGQWDRILPGAFSDVDGFAHWRRRCSLHRRTAEPLKRHSNASAACCQIPILSSGFRRTSSFTRGIPLQSPPIQYSVRLPKIPKGMLRARIKYHRPSL